MGCSSPLLPGPALHASSTAVAGIQIKCDLAQLALAGQEGKRVAVKWERFPGDDTVLNLCPSCDSAAGPVRHSLVAL